MVEKIIAKTRPDALPTMGGQTALNCALDLAKRACSTKYGVETDRRHAGGHRQSRKTAAVSSEAMTKIGLGSARNRHRPCHGAGAGRSAMIGFPTDHPPLVHHGRHRRRHRLQQEEFIEIVARGLEASP